MRINFIILSILAVLTMFSCRKIVVASGITSANSNYKLNEGEISLQVSVSVEDNITRSDADLELKAATETEVQNAILLVYGGIDAAATLEIKTLITVQNSNFNQVKITGGEKSISIIVNPTAAMISQTLGTQSGGVWTGALEIGSTVSELEALTCDCSAYPGTTKFTMIGAKAKTFIVDKESNEVIPVSIPVSRIVAKVGLSAASSVLLPSESPATIASATYDLLNLIGPVTHSQFSFNLTQTPKKNYTYRLAKGGFATSATGVDAIDPETKKYPNISYINYSTDFKAAVASFSSLSVASSIYCPENINHSVTVGNSTFAVVKLKPQITKWLTVSGVGNERVLSTVGAQLKDQTGVYYGYFSNVYKRYLAPFKTKADALAAILLNQGLSGEVADAKVKTHAQGACYYRLDIKDEVGDVSYIRVLPNHQYQITIQSISEFGVAAPEDLIPVDGGIAHGDAVIRASIVVRPWSVVTMDGNL